MIMFKKIEKRVMILLALVRWASSLPSSALLSSSVEDMWRMSDIVSRSQRRRNRQKVVCRMVPPYQKQPPHSIPQHGKPTAMRSMDLR